MRGTGRSATAAAAALLALAACGIPEEKYNAQVSEAQRYKKSLEDESRRVKDCEQKVADLETRLGRTEQARTAVTEEAERQRALASQLAGEAERQRQLASRLEQEKTALAKKSAEYEALTSSLGEEIKAGRVQITELQGKMTVRLAERVLFRSGSAAIGREGKEALKKVAAAFRDLKGRIVRVEGHTDDVPIHTDQFPSNWELSAARAIAVVRFLQEQGVDPGALGAAGYAAYQPIQPNDTAEGRAANRRIEISLATPPPATPTAQ